MDLNNREIAILIWLSMFVVAMSFNKDVRNSFGNVLKSLFQFKLTILFASATLYAGICVFMLKLVQIWTFDNAKTTVVWLLTFGFVTMGDVLQADDKPKKLVKLLKEAVGATAIVAYIAEFESFSLWVEFIFVPFMAILGMLLAISSTKSEYNRVQKLLNALQTIIGMGILIYSIFAIFEHFAKFASLRTLRDFGVPVILTAMFLPFLYALLLYATYENVSLRLNRFEKNVRLRQYAIFRGMWVFRRELEYFHRFIRDLRMSEELSRAKIDQCLGEVRLQQKREKNPPVVFWDDGWSPYEALKFLDEEGLIAEDYHFSYDTWCAYSPSQKYGEGIFPATFSYHIYGNEFAVTRLKLKMDIFFVGRATDPGEQFVKMASALIEKAISPQAADEFIEKCAGQETAVMTINGVKVAVTTEFWGAEGKGGYYQYLHIQHPKDDGGIAF